MLKDILYKDGTAFEKIFLPPYTWERKYSKLISTSEVEKLWPGYTSAADARYGNWPKEVIPFEQYDSPLKNWFDFQVKAFANQRKLIALDIGCGNGSSSVEGYSLLLKNHPISTVILLDIQKKGVEHASNLFRSRIPHSNITSMVADMSNKTLVSEILTRTGGKLLDVITCIKALYFCHGSKLKSTISSLSDLLSPGGSIYFTLVSIYNPMGIGVNNNKALRDIEKLVSKDYQRMPLTLYQPEMDSVVSLFTREAISTVFKGSGLKIVDVVDICWNKNGHGKDYPEAFGVSLVKE